MANCDSPDDKICIVEAALFAQKAKLNPSVQMGRIEALEKGMAMCPLRRVDLVVLPKGVAAAVVEKALFQDGDHVTFIA